LLVGVKLISNPLNEILILNFVKERYS